MVKRFARISKNIQIQKSGTKTTEKKNKRSSATLSTMMHSSLVPLLIFAAVV
jgi:hypothetical protein